MTPIDTKFTFSLKNMSLLFELSPSLEFLTKNFDRHKHSKRTFELSNFGSLTQESELSGVFWPQGHEISVRLSETPTYPGYDLSEAFWLE